MDQNNPNSPKCSMIIRYNTESNSRAKVLYNSLRVDREPSTVIRELGIEGSSLIINLSSSSISKLRASSDGILENLKTLMDVIQKFEITEVYEYSHL